MRSKTEKRLAASLVLIRFMILKVVGQRDYKKLSLETSRADSKSLKELKKIFRRARLLLYLSHSLIV